MGFIAVFVTWEDRAPGGLQPVPCQVRSGAYYVCMGGSDYWELEGGTEYVPNVIRQ